MRLQIDNQTDWRTADLRRMLQAACKRQGLRQLPGQQHYVIVRYTRKWGPHGRASLLRRGPSFRQARLWLWLPREATKPAAFRAECAPLSFTELIAALIHHEVLHWAGVRHKDMTRQAYLCSAPPQWFDSTVHTLEKAPVSTPTARNYLHRKVW